MFSSHIQDIALLHKAGLKVVIIPGARKRIDEVLSLAKITWKYHDNIRITQNDAMPLIKMAAFDVSNEVMTRLAANNITAIIGNWVKSRAKGIIDGFDFGTAGEIEKLQKESIMTVLNDGFIPIFPCIGWNSVGHPYNISSLLLAKTVAVTLKADKLFFVTGISCVNSNQYEIPENIAISENGDVPAMNIEETEEFIKTNKKDSPVIKLMQTALEACKNGVTRVHLLDGNRDGVLPCEIFSGLGSGTMIYTNGYGKIRQMNSSDVSSVFSLQRPFVQNGKLLPRTEDEISLQLNDYIVYEVDGGIKASAALHKYEDGQAEICAVAVEKSYEHMGIGLKLINSLIQKANENGIYDIFILTTQAIDWFEQLGFVLDTVNSLPLERQKKWNPKRNSKVFRLKIKSKNQEK